MKHMILAAAGAAIAFTSPAAAQSQQEQLDARYNRALAAGYKALFMCGAIANAERNGINRSPESVEKWELTGIYPRIADIVPDLEYVLLRDADKRLRQVQVTWADDMPPRFAEASGDDGCRLAPIGLAPPMPETAVLAGPDEDEPKRMPLKISVTSSLSPYKAVVAKAFDGTYGEGARTTAVIVSQPGKGYSHFHPDFGPYRPQRTWSVAKSIAATIIGAAVQRGEADVGTALAHPSWRWDERRAITIDDLLRMASGRYSDTPGNRTDPLYMGGSTVEETATGWPLLYKPGTVYRYANNDTLLAIKAIEDTFDDYSPADFFRDVGMPDTVAETDWAGDYVLSSQVWATADDLAWLGVLYVNDGKTSDGRRILPEGWTEYVSTPSGPQPDNGFGYGAGFWLFNQHEGIPPDTFAAMGNRGQYVVMIPSLKLVIVRRGEDPAGERFDIVAFTRDVVAEYQPSE